jgi:hypothetical protein
VRIRVSLLAILSIVAILVAIPSSAQDRPFFVTYDHILEHQGDLEVGVFSTTGVPKTGESAYTAPWLEIEYGLRDWWTSEIYLEGVTTTRDGGGFAGWRWEHRFRPMRRAHVVNPILYVEYERISEASRIQKELVGDGPLAFGPIRELRSEVANELEGKLILSSAFGPWTVAENFTIEKNLSEDEGYEFGYSVGAARAYSRSNLAAGVEAYGALGSSRDVTVAAARHYLAPVVQWKFGNRSALKASIGFGLTKPSDHLLIRVGFVHEWDKR